MLAINHVSLSYGDTKVLADLNFIVNSGEICAIIGASGCGKTSLVNILAGNLKNYSGTVTLDGEKINYRNKNIGLIQQDYGLLPWKTVYKNIILPIQVKRLQINDFHEKIQYVMTHLQLKGLEKRYPNQLSGGQKQRVAIARAFIMDLDMLLMDEPFSALDELTREETQRLFSNIWSEKKPLTIFVTHSVDEALLLGRKIAVLQSTTKKIAAMVDNPFYGHPKSRGLEAYRRLHSEIRGTIQR